LVSRLRAIVREHLVEMRKDAFEKTRLPTSPVEERLPFNLD